MNEFTGKDPAATRKCSKCGVEKLILIDYPSYTKNGICRTCTNLRTKEQRHKNQGQKPGNGWKDRRFQWTPSK